MTSKQKKMIVGGVFSAVVVGLCIFLILFFVEIGPFSKYVDPEPFSKYVDPEDFWKKVEEIVKEDKSYNEQWYVKSKRQQESNMWSVELYGSLDKDPATKDTVEKMIEESKMFAWSKMTKDQTDECSADYDMQEAIIEEDSKGDELSNVVRLTERVHVNSKDFWNKVDEIRKKETSYKQWYITRQKIRAGNSGAGRRFVLLGSKDSKKANKASIEKTIKEAAKFICSDMKFQSRDGRVGIPVRDKYELEGSKYRKIAYEHLP